MSTELNMTNQIAMNEILITLAKVGKAYPEVEAQMDMLVKRVKSAHSFASMEQIEKQIELIKKQFPKAF